MTKPAQRQGTRVAGGHSRSTVGTVDPTPFYDVAEQRDANSPPPASTAALCPLAPESRALGDPERSAALRLAEAGMGANPAGPLGVGSVARIRRAVRARGYFPNEVAALKRIHMALMSMDPTGKGRKRWTMR